MKGINLNQKFKEDIINACEAAKADGKVISNGDFVTCPIGRLADAKGFNPIDNRDYLIELDNLYGFKSNEIWHTAMGVDDASSNRVKNKFIPIKLYLEYYELGKELAVYVERYVISHVDTPTPKRQNIVVGGK